MSRRSDEAELNRMRETLVRELLAAGKVLDWDASLRAAKRLNREVMVLRVEILTLAGCLGATLGLMISAWLGLLPWISAGTGLALIVFGEAVLLTGGAILTLAGGCHK